MEIVFIINLDSLFLEYIKSLSPSSIDFELQSITETIDFVSFIDAMTNGLNTLMDFELIEAYMNAFLKIHGESIILMNDRSQVVEKLNQFISISEVGWKRLETLLKKSISHVDFIRL